jgi:hypothetical protein
MRSLFVSEDSGGSNSERGKGWAKEQKDRVDRALDDVEQAKQTPLEYTSVRVQKSYEKPKLPCVFLHGLFGFATLTPFISLPQLTFDYWRGVIDVLEENGVEVLVTNATTSASIEERAKDACKMIEERFAGREVNLLVSVAGGTINRSIVLVRERSDSWLLALAHRDTPWEV